MFSQHFANEWVNTSQEYYKFNISNTGIYKITNAELISAGVPISNFNPQNIQLFQKGKEIPCYIKGEQQGVIEYIIFYAKKNDGWLDIDMYDSPTSQTNPNLSLINDTSAVFFTWNSSFNNERFDIEVDTNYVSYTPENFCWVNTHIDYHNSYFTAKEDCEYVKAEGWFDNQVLNLGSSITKKISTPNFIDIGLKCNLEFAFITFSKYNHHINIKCADFETDTIFNSYNSIKYKDVKITPSLNETDIIFSSIDDKGSITSKSVVSYIDLKYTHNFDAGGEHKFLFNLSLSNSKKTYIEVKNFKSDGEPYLFDLTNNNIISVTKSGNLYKALLPKSDSEAKLLLVDDRTFLTTDIKNVRMVNHSNKNKKYLIISQTKLMKSAQDYANYRNAYLVDVEELYNQFGYGINKHPMAIRNYLQYILKTWSVKPENLFIIGKAIEAKQTRYNSDIYKNCLVPTMGQHGSDILLSNKIIDNKYSAAIPTGRIAATTNDDVYLYLNKVQEFENNSVDEWMKRAIHFGGGANTTEQNQFREYLNNYEKIFVDTLFGGYVSTFLKTSSDPIEISKSDSITNLINNGVTLMTFFGHGSSVNGFDQNIDNPSAYNNKGKYPIILTNSCYSGNIHLNGRISESEEWVLIKDKGAIGFLAVVGSGYASFLNIISEAYYKNICYKSYGKSLGDIIRQSHIDVQNRFPDSYFAKITIQEFTLHGDPAIVLNSFNKPDLTIKSGEVSFSPKNITTEIDSFYMYIIPTNQAKITKKSFIVHINREFLSGDVVSKSVRIDGLYYKDTIKVKFAVNKVKGIGINKFNIIIDAFNEVDELDETNNVLNINTYISSTAVTPVYPYKYSINSVSNPILKLSNVDVLSDEQSTVLQIDTSYLFNSPMLITQNITHSGGIIEWNPILSYQKGVTYFWRSAKNNNKKIWANSSFILDDVKNGWNQSCYGQFINNNFKFLERDDVKQEFNFADAAKTLICKNMGSPSNETEFQSIAFGIDGIGERSSCGPASAMLLVVIDSLTLLPWQSNYANVGEIGHSNDPWCSNKTKPQNYFIFQSDNIDNITKMVDFVTNEVPDNNYILIYSFRNGNFENYNEHILSFFENLGATNIRFVSNYIPYIFFAKKGDISFAKEVIGTDTHSKIELYKDLKNNFTYGSMMSQNIGPATKWQTLNWKYHNKENNPNEIAFIKLYGIDNSDNTILLKDSIKSTSIQLTDIDPNTYPYLKMLFYTEDKTFRTPAQLDFWEVIYNSVTDLALNPAKQYSFYNDTLKEGEEAKFSIAFENIGTKDVDSVIVSYWIQNSKNENIELKNHRIAPLKAGNYTVDTINFSTLNLSGNNNLWVEINPANTKKSIREQYYFNNLAQQPFFVSKDNMNPLLDVTFDGVHIMDGDLVSANPEIMIQLKDENTFIPLNDTSLFLIYLKSKETGIERKISLSNNPNLQFIPAKLPENKAQILYRKRFDKDGTYILRVQSKDLSGNESGKNDYTISFKVITESTITNVFNYPNPFSTSTRFVFELTGYIVPDDMSIEILTVTGKVVKVIYMDDLGPINIGRNITQYSWDGTDMYGSPLANGVYFYRVNARLNGKEIKIRDTGTNQYFKNGFGKMYLMR